MKPIRFHPEADSEMVKAAVWYESQHEGLGKRFLTSVQDTLNDASPPRSGLLEDPEIRTIALTIPLTAARTRLAPASGGG